MSPERAKPDDAIPRGIPRVPRFAHPRPACLCVLCAFVRESVVPGSVKGWIAQRRKATKVPSLVTRRLQSFLVFARRPRFSAIAAAETSETPARAFMRAFVIRRIQRRLPAHRFG